MMNIITISGCCLVLIIIIIWIVLCMRNRKESFTDAEYKAQCQKQLLMPTESNIAACVANKKITAQYTKPTNTLNWCRQQMPGANDREISICASRMNNALDPNFSKSVDLSALARLGGR